MAHGILGVGMAMDGRDGYFVSTGCGPDPCSTEGGGVGTRDSSQPQDGTKPRCAPTRPGGTDPLGDTREDPAHDATCRAGACTLAEQDTAHMSSGNYTSPPGNIAVAWRVVAHELQGVSEVGGRPQGRAMVHVLLIGD